MRRRVAFAQRNGVTSPARKKVSVGTAEFRNSLLTNLRSSPDCAFTTRTTLYRLAEKYGMHAVLQCLSSTPELSMASVPFRSLKRIQFLHLLF